MRWDELQVALWRNTACRSLRGERSCLRISNLKQRWRSLAVSGVAAAGSAAQGDALRAGQTTSSLLCQYLNAVFSGCSALALPLLYMFPIVLHCFFLRLSSMSRFLARNCLGIFYYQVVLFQMALPLTVAGSVVQCVSCRPRHRCQYRRRRCGAVRGVLSPASLPLTVAGSVVQCWRTVPGVAANDRRRRCGAIRGMLAVRCRTVLLPA